MALQPIPNYLGAVQGSQTPLQQFTSQAADLQGLQANRLAMQQSDQQHEAERQAQQQLQQFRQAFAEQLQSGSPDYASLAQQFPGQLEQIQRVRSFQQQLRERGVTQASGQLVNALDRGDTEGAKAIIQQNAGVIDGVGDPSFTTQTALQLAEQDPKQLRDIAIGTYSLSGGKPEMLGEAAQTAGQREFETLTKGLSPEDAEKARRIKLGLDPRAMGSAAQTITQLGNVEEVAQTEGQLAAGREAGKLSSQLKLQPEIRKAVDTAARGAAALADQAIEDRSNESTFNVYETGMSGLVEALGGTETGPFVGRLPAVTADQQIAEGAVAAMAPVLKQMFRAAGEGVFTDKDQELLLAMVPTRKDKPEAIQAKLENIDAIVRAKLGVQQQQQPAQAQEPTLDELLQKYGG